MDTLPYLIFEYDIPQKVFVCVNLVDARCTAVNTTREGAVKHMEDLWDARNKTRGVSMDQDSPYTVRA